MFGCHGHSLNFPQKLGEFISCIVWNSRQSIGQQLRKGSLVLWLAPNSNFSDLNKSKGKKTNES
jgi:hypothetical protein